MQVLRRAAAAASAAADDVDVAAMSRLRDHSRRAASPRGSESVRPIVRSDAQADACGCSCGRKEAASAHRSSIRSASRPRELIRFPGPHPQSGPPAPPSPFAHRPATGPSPHRRSPPRNPYPVIYLDPRPPEPGANTGCLVPSATRTSLPPGDPNRPQATAPRPAGHRRDAAPDNPSGPLEPVRAHRIGSDPTPLAALPTAADRGGRSVTYTRTVPVTVPSIPESRLPRSGGGSDST